MSQFPSLKAKDVEKILLRNGFFFKRQSGSHKIFYHPEKQISLPVPFHGGDLPKGTLRAIISESGVEEKEFFKKK